MVSVTEIAPPASHVTMKMGKNPSVLFKGHLKFGVELLLADKLIYFQEWILYICWETAVLFFKLGDSAK